MNEETKATEAATTSTVRSRRIELVEPEDGIIRAYANHHRFGWTSYDVRLLFGEIVDFADDKITIEETTQVTMSWQQAEELLGTLQKLIADHNQLTATPSRESS